jgi:hypothetical protein
VVLVELWKDFFALFGNPVRRLAFFVNSNKLYATAFKKEREDFANRVVAR